MTATKEIEQVEAIKALIQYFFDKINDNDPRGLQALFIPEAHLQVLRQDPPLEPSSSSLASNLHLPHQNISQEKSQKFKEKITRVFNASIEAFIKLIEDGEKRRKPGQPRPNVHEVPNLNATDVKLDGLLAQAWCPFAVTFDGKLHHYGHFDYTFVKNADEWHIAGLTQGYRRATGWESEIAPEIW